jgi:hypothetical protein
VVRAAGAVLSLKSEAMRRRKFIGLLGGAAVMRQ